MLHDSVSWCKTHVNRSYKWGTWPSTHTLKTHMLRSIIKLYMGIYIYIWLVVYLTLWKIRLRQLGWWNYQLNGKNVPNLWCCTFVHKWSNKSICNYPTPSHSATHLKKTLIPHLTNCIPSRKWAGFRGNKSIFRFNMIQIAIFEESWVLPFLILNTIYIRWFVNICPINTSQKGHSLHVFFHSKSWSRLRRAPRFPSVHSQGFGIEDWLSGDMVGDFMDIEWEIKGVKWNFMGWNGIWLALQLAFE